MIEARERAQLTQLEETIKQLKHTWRQYIEYRDKDCDCDMHRPERCRRCRVLKLASDDLECKLNALP